MEPNLGSGNSILGGDANAALQEAMARRQQGSAGQTSQVTPASASFDPSTQPGMTPPAQAGTPGVPPTQTQTQGAGLAQGTPFETVESKMILGAMKGRMDAITKMQLNSFGGQTGA